MSAKRIQQRRTKGWRKPEGAVAVGRGTKWGNPFKVGDAQVRMPALNGGEWEHEGRLHKTSGQYHTFFHPAPLGEPMPVTWHRVENATAEQCVRLFAERIGAKPLVHSDYRAPNHAEFRAAVRAELAGKDLMCWCPLDQPCHADVLLELANPTTPIPRRSGVMIAIGTGESPPWAGLPLACPVCGEGPLTLHRSTSEDGKPGLLSYIKHCGSAWVRGPIRNEGATS